MNWFFIFFFISGFCSVLYELVWLRLSMAQFGVTTAMVSIVLSVFMAGLGLGSWASGRWLRWGVSSRRFSALRLYALTELLIGVSGILVPFVLLWGRRVLENSGLSSSLTYYFVAGLLITFTLLPWCALMGATMPIAMCAIGQILPQETRRSFSYLYMANVAGAVAGTTIPLFLIELLGFRGTLKVGVACNCLIAISAFVLSRQSLQPEPVRLENEVAPPHAGAGSSKILALLFLSGLTSMAMEVVWVRAYTPYFGTVVYAFASILSVYLLATWIGSIIYRKWSTRREKENPLLWTLLATSALIPLVATSPSVGLTHTPLPPHLAQQILGVAPRLVEVPRLVLGITFFTGLLGFITPMLVDRFSAGNPAKAGIAYATNVAGCILGPLIAGFALLPFISERGALIVLSLPLLIIGLAPLYPRARSRPAVRFAVCTLMVFSTVLMVVGKDFEESFIGEHKVLRDPTATVIATHKRLLVNGYSMTELTPITKVMAHFPLAFLNRSPQDALVICFGMGTTFRSLRSWGLPVTAVDLVPSVPRLFSYFHGDGESVLASPLSHVVIDDGRRYMERTAQQYDVITIDPPPPLQAAGSSLLYSEEFYGIAKQHLRPGGILQQWLPTLPDRDPVNVAAVAHSLRDSFPYIRVFRDGFGLHFLCSDQPIPQRSATELLQRIPPSAVVDLAEWDQKRDGGDTEAASVRLSTLVTQELALDPLIAASPHTPALTDDRPINEYYMLRKWFGQTVLAASRP